MRGLAANHCRAARFLLSVVARRIGEEALSLATSSDPIENRLAGAELTLTHDEVAAGMTRRPFGPLSNASASTPVTVRLELTEPGGALGRAIETYSVFVERRRARKLLTIVPPRDFAADHDEWVHDSCDRLGLVVPPAKPFAALDESMEAARRRAVGASDGASERSLTDLVAMDFGVDLPS